MADACCECAKPLTPFELEAAVICAKCGRGPYCSDCAGTHAETCQKPLPTKNIDIPEDCPQYIVSDHGFTCASCRVEFPAGEDAVHWMHKMFCLDCQPKFMVEAKSNRFREDHLPTSVHLWFSLRKPTEQEAKTLDELRRGYGLMARSLLSKCPSNPDRTVAMRQLKESMQTAISSIVCADAWQTPKED